jgi:hypothetical protein
MFCSGLHTYFTLAISLVINLKVDHEAWKLYEIKGKLMILEIREKNQVFLVTPMWSVQKVGTIFFMFSDMLETEYSPLALMHSS